MLFFFGNIFFFFPSSPSTPESNGHLFFQEQRSWNDGTSRLFSIQQSHRPATSFLASSPVSASTRPPTYPSDQHLYSPTIMNMNPMPQAPAQPGGASPDQVALFNSVFRENCPFKFVFGGVTGTI